MLLDPPDYIIITLLDNKTQKVRDKDTIPEDFNLLQDEDSRKIMIPVQNIIKNQVELEKVDIEYKDHPLELAFAFTVWKVQGLTFDKIILALEPLKGKIGHLKIFMQAIQELEQIMVLDAYHFLKDLIEESFLIYVQTLIQQDGEWILQKEISGSKIQKVLS